MTEKAKERDERMSEEKQDRIIKDTLQIQECCGVVNLLMLIAIFLLIAFG